MYIPLTISININIRDNETLKAGIETPDLIEYNTVSVFKNLFSRF